MPEKEDIQSILSELKKALSGPTKKDTSEITAEIEKRILAARNASTPITPVPAKPPATVQAQPVIKTQSPSNPRTELPKRVTGEPSRPAAVSNITRPDAKLAPTSTGTVQPNPVTAKLAIQQPAVLSPELPKNILRFACFYPYGEEQVCELFLSNLIEVMKKTSKKVVDTENLPKRQIDPFKTDWQEIISECTKSAIKSVFFINRNEIETEEIKNKFASRGIFFYNIEKTKVHQRMIYVDLAIEVSLSSHLTMQK